MEQSDFEGLMQMLRADEPVVRTVTIPDSMISDLTREQAEEIAARFGGTTLITLPEREQEFFTWLGEKDPGVWRDLWGDAEQPYVVSISFLPELLPKRRGFLICDLVEHQNFFFTQESITPEEGKIFLDAALDIVHAHGQLSMEQAIVIEAWRAPIDLWRFAYNYKLPLDDVKKMVLWLLREEILLLPPTKEESAEDASTSSNGEAGSE